MFPSLERRGNSNSPLARQTDVGLEGSIRRLAEEGCYHMIFVNSHPPSRSSVTPRNDKIHCGTVTLSGVEG